VNAIYSMTGYAAAVREFAYGALNVEVRSVNHRYLDLQFRLPDELRSVEPQLRETLTARVVRGKVECRVQFSPLAAARRIPDLDEALLQQIIQLDTKVRIAFPSASNLRVVDVLRWPGVLGSDTLPTDELKGACFELLEEALEDFSASRAREGEKLKVMLEERASTMEKLIAEVLPRMPKLLTAYQDKLAQRLREAMAGADEERVRQEVALFANKIDVDEELTRLIAHLAELKRIVRDGGAAGKRLDFLMQELNREANTLGSKSVDIGVTQTSMELKLLIEQMREQIQNIE